MVVIHAGEPKTGTTFLQQLMFGNRGVLAEQGVLLPGPRPLYHWRAAQDLLEVRQIPNDPVGPFRGTWDRLAKAALRAPRVAIVSHEVLAAVTEEQAGRAVRSFGAAEVHVVLTVRDMASLIPAEWQETVKHRNTRSWSDWIADIIDAESPRADRRTFLFWKVHDTVELARIWALHVPPERVHIITVPRRGAAPGLLWDRFAALIGVDPASVDTDRARANASLGLAEVEMLRRVNARLPPTLPNWFYMWGVKEKLAHQALAGRRSALGRLELPTDRDAWASQYAETTIAALGRGGYDVIGDLDELRPRPDEGHRTQPGDAADGELLDAGVTAVVALLGELAELRGVSTTPVTAEPLPGTQHGRLVSRVIALSQRHHSVHRARRAYWILANTARRLRAERSARGER